MAAVEIPEEVGFRSRVFKPTHFQQVNPVGEYGYSQTLNRSAPLWYAEYETPPLKDDKYNAAVAFLDSLEGSMNTFLGYDPRRIKPFAYRDQPFLSTPWGTTPKIYYQDYATSVISLKGMTVASIVTKGDLISVKVGSIWYLFRAQETRTANASGRINSLVVTPRPQIQDLGETVIRYHKPCAEMKMIGDYEEDDSVDSYPIIRFRAAQFINRVPDGV
jgi:hypothetical protein